MTTTTALSITRAARVLADLVDEGIAAGLPEPFSIHMTTYAEHTISVRDFEAVEEWAKWLDVEPPVLSVGNDDQWEFFDADCEHAGVTFRVIANRRVQS